MCVHRLDFGAEYEGDPFTTRDANPLLSNERLADRTVRHCGNISFPHTFPSLAKCILEPNEWLSV